MVIDECCKCVSTATTTSADGAIEKASDLCLRPQYAVFSKDCCIHSLAFVLCTHVSSCEPVFFCRGSSGIFNQMTRSIAAYDFVRQNTGSENFYFARVRF